MTRPLDPVWRMLAKEAGVRAPHVYHCFMAMKAEKGKFNPASFADFCDLQIHHIDAIMAAFECHNLLSQSVPKVSSDKGQRLPGDFSMPSDWLLWAQTERGWTLDVAKTEAENFTDFWHAKPGSAGVKLDWRATWRNWVRNSRKANGEWRPQTETTHQEREEGMRRTIALYRKMGRNQEADDMERALQKA